MQIIRIGEKTVWMALGTILTAAGVISLLLPIIPATPFLILALACFAKSSTRVNRIISESKLFSGLNRRIPRTMPNRKKDMKTRTETEWKNILSKEQYRTLRKKGTEPAFTGELLHNHEEGVYKCAGCQNVLFTSDKKYDSGSGWPSFWDVIDEGNVELKTDDTHGMDRVEVVCRKCGGHLGHLFDDGPKSTGKRYCINSAALDFDAKDLSGGR